MHLCCRLGISSIPLAGPAGCARIASGRPARRPARAPDDSLPPPSPRLSGHIRSLQQSAANAMQRQLTRLSAPCIWATGSYSGMLRICRAPSQPVELTHVSPIAVRLEGTVAGDSPSPRGLLQTHQTSRQASTACQVPSWKMRKEHEPWNRGGCGSCHLCFARLPLGAGIFRRGDEPLPRRPQAQHLSHLTPYRQSYSHQGTPS